MHSAPFDAETFSRLVGDLYDSAVDPSLWPQSLEAVRLALDMHNASLDLFDTANVRILISVRTGIPEEYYNNLSDYGPDITVLWDGIFVNSNRPLDEPAAAMMERPVVYRNTRMFQEWARPQGICDLMGLTMMREPTRVAALGCGRHEKYGLIGPREMEGMRLLAPHIRRAVTISNLLDAAAINATRFDAILDTLTIGVALVDGRSQLLHANRSARDIIAERAALRPQRGVLRARQPQADAALRRAIMLALQGDAAMGAAGIGLPAVHPDGGGVVAHVLPLVASRPTRAWHGEAVAAVFLARQGTPLVIPVEALMTLFDLTPAEARVLASIAGGKTPAETASALSIAETTVRTHLLRIFGKTGTHRQAELVSLVSALQAPVKAR